MSEELLRKHYAATALARMGVPFARGIQIEAVRIVVEAAALAEIRRRVPGWRPQILHAELEHTPPELARWLVELAARCKVPQ